MGVGILHSQRVLAEVTEMIRTSNILHNSVLNIYNKDSEVFQDLNYGNTLSLLTGIINNFIVETESIIAL